MASWPKKAPMKNDPLVVLGEKLESSPRARYGFFWWCAAVVAPVLFAPVVLLLSGFDSGWTYVGLGLAELTGLACLSQIPCGPRARLLSAFVYLLMGAAAFFASSVIVVLLAYRI